MTQRLFVAIWLPDEVRSSLQSAIRPLPGDYPELRWQPPQRWHITLGFLGDRDPARTTERFGRIPTPPAAPLRLAGSGRFGPILWIGVDSAPWLAALAGSVHEVMGSRDRRFRGHVTIARARTGTGRREIGAAAGDLLDYRSPKWTPAEVTLVRSVTGPHPSYEVIARSPLTCDGSGRTA
ncbi:MAG TPA: RNA 2',3'-cyclic phosphodiesterase [Actinomycetota bacterium]|nr:RNA 2',3'-cyclic phosphodiesterase [Actinomycetota bacterium]